MLTMTHAPTGPVLAERAIEDGVGATVAVVSAVAAMNDTPIRDLPPLESVVDTDALDALFEGRHSAGSVYFEYFGFLVAVHAAGYVSVHETPLG